MKLILKPLYPVFVAEATGLDLTKPISRADACEINAAMNGYGVLVWRGQPLTAQQQIRFATAFGPLCKPICGGVSTRSATRWSIRSGATKARQSWPCRRR